MQAIHVDTRELPPQLRGITSRKTVTVRVAEQVSIHADDGTWSGGSRTTHSAVELATGREVPITDVMSAPWDSSRRDRLIVLKPGYAIVQYSVFCGKHMDPAIWIHPQSAAPLLPAPGPTLSADEAALLDVTCGYKAAYRRQYLGFSGARYELAKRSLKSMGYLNAMGAVTTKGRNARPQR